MISSEYLDQITKLHSTKQWGASGYSHAPIVAKYYHEIGAKTILDYGCGRATLKTALIKIDPEIKSDCIFEYDPAIEDKNKLPEPVDLLVANDVLEHIEPEYFCDTLAYLRSLAKIGAYFTIALTPSKVSLPDGRNAHLIIENEAWWLSELKGEGFNIVKAEMRKGLWVWAR